MNSWLYLIPVISAVTGWLFQSLAIRMVFRPAKPVFILGYQLQGFLPKRKHALAEKLGEAAANFVSFEEIEKKLGDPGNLKKILPFIEEQIDHFLRVKLKETMPMIGMLIGDRTINQLKQVFVSELELLFPKIMQQYASSLQQDMDIKQIVVQRINNISDQDFESLIYQQMSHELRRLKVYGLFFGLFLGLVQLAFVWLIKK